MTRPAGSRKALATFGSGPMRRVLRATLPTFRELARRHGYELVVGDGDAAGRKPQWAKILLLQRLVERFELVLWLDADAIVLDATEDPADVLPARAFQGLVRHISTRTGRELPNTGVWLLRGGSRSAAFLAQVWDAHAHITHPIWQDNAAVLLLLGYSVQPPGWRVRESVWMEGTFWLPEEWNRVTWQGPRTPVRIRHYAGVPDFQRWLALRGDLHDSIALRSSGPRRLTHRASGIGWRGAGLAYRWVARRAT